MDPDATEVVCNECESVPKLVEIPYRDDSNYMVVCDCALRGIAVDACVNNSSLLEPPSGKWYDIDA